MVHVSSPWYMQAPKVSTKHTKFFQPLNYTFMWTSNFYWYEHVYTYRSRQEFQETQKGGKKAKVRLTVAFFVSADGQKVDEPVIIWKSKKPHCFKNLKGRDLIRALGVHYFANNKVWMTSEIMSDVLKRLDRKIKLQNRNVVLFLGNATSHQESIDKNLSNIK